ncbi:MAG: lipoate--protein ligase [Eubacterium sp.]|nr:lipoate--protein ligase [Eubacterium sp.]
MFFLDNTLSTDPTFNLALEEYVFETLPKGERCFMLWQNDNAVIIGKHQNTVEEIDQAFVEARGIKVVRRLTGGGAVYHDLGNLNFTFITDGEPGESLDFKTFTQPVIDALKKLGVAADFNSRNDLAIDGKKFSGNSQYARRGRILHHGTLLFNARLDVVQQALRVKPEKIESKGVKSVRSRVTNIVDYLEKPYTLEEFRKALVEAMFARGSLTPWTPSEADLMAVKKLQRDKYATWAWNYGESPAYDLRKDRKYPCGLVSVLMTVDQGKIKTLRFFGDFFGSGDTSELEAHFTGCPMTREMLAERLGTIRLGDYIDGMQNEEFLDLMLY